MVRLSKFQRLVLVTASTMIVGGVLSNGDAFAVPAAPHSATVTAAGRPDAASQWNEITDVPSGIAVQLPGKPEVHKSTDAGVDGREYVVSTGYGAMAFSVYDEPGSDPTEPWNLDGGLKGAVDGYNSVDTGAKLKSTDVHDGVQDGDHYLEAKLVGVDGKVGHIRLVDVGEQAIMIFTVGTGDQRDTVDRDYQQVLHSIELPEHTMPQSESSAVAT